MIPFSRLLQRSGGSWLQEDWRRRVMQLNPHIKNPDRIGVNQLVLVPENPNEIILQDQVDYVSRVQNATKDSFLRGEIERFARSQEEARRRQRFLNQLDRISELSGVGVIYYDEFSVPVKIMKS